MLKRTVLGMVIAVGAAGLAGCAHPASPVLGVIFADVKYGDTATTATGNKVGKACATSILGWVAQGDASVAAAKANGGISEVSLVDHTAKNMLGIFGEWCTIVKGK